MFTDNTIIHPRGPRNADMEYIVKLLGDKAEKRHNHTKEDILEFMDHNHDERYYRLDQHLLKLWYSGHGNPDNQVGEHGDFYVDTLNGMIYQKNGTYWEPQFSTIGPEGKPGIQGIPGVPGPEGRPGAKGEPGKKGDPGRGIASIRRIKGTGQPGSTDVYLVTYSDNMTYQFEIYNGKDGDMMRYTYDTNNDGIVDNAELVNGHTVDIDVPSNAKFTDTTYTAGEGISIDENNVIHNTQTSAEWGNIIGVLSEQSDLQKALDNKVNLQDITEFITKDVNNLTNYELKSNTGNALALSIDPLTYLMTLQLKNSVGTVLSTQQVDLPLESMVVNARYSNGVLTLILKNDQTLDIDISAIIRGLVPDARKIAGIDLADDITKTELQAALEISNLVSTALTDHYTKTQVDSLLNNKVDKETGKGLFSGNYNDLTNKPTIPVVPTNISAFNNDTGYITGYTETDPTVPTHVKNITSADINSWNNKSEFSGSYNDLTNKPTIPTVPTKVSAFENDIGYLTEHQDLSGKQDKLTAGENITIEENVISASGKPTGDTLPIGSVVDFDGDVIPENWEAIDGGDILDTLDSTSTIDALSANQGKVLNEKIDNNINNINTQINTVNTSLNNIASNTYSIKHFVVTNNTPEGPTWWRILRLPLEFTGFIILIMPNYDGRMYVGMLKIAYAYGSPTLTCETSTAFAGRLYQKARICYTQGSNGYLEILGANNDCIGKAMDITCIGGFIGSFTSLSEEGNDTDRSVLTIDI